MNLHVAQSLTATAEEKTLMLINQHIITPQSARPVLGFVQDCMTSMFELSKPGVLFREDQAMMLYTQLKYPQQPFQRRRQTTGAQMFSYILPASLDYSGHGVRVRAGQLEEGLLTSKVLGTSNGGLIHTLSRYPTDGDASIERSLEATQRFISDGQRLGVAFFALRGFTISVDDITTSEETQSSVVAFLKDGCRRAMDEADHDATFDRQKSQRELNILARLDKATSEGGALAQKAMKPNNNVRSMLEAGSKGKLSNVMQMSACVGQQIISGYRPRLGYELSGRTLPHFSASESTRDPDAQGFVHSSFVKGLNSIEYFSHSQGGREGMTDTAVKSVTGDTIIMIREQGGVKATRIGDWIDNRLRRADPATIKRYPQQLNTELLQLKDAVTIPTVDAFGKIFWSSLTAITRHDSDGVLYHVTVGAEVDGVAISVVVPASKSLLIWREKSGVFVPIATTKVRVGDKVPVAHQRTLIFGDDGAALLAKGYINDRDRRNDVSLKPIIDIKSTKCDANTKLYDVTVPSTYNFVLANGLGVRDTGESGYFTRKLIKFFENTTVAYDGTVRINGPSAQIVQFAYGDDGIDPTFLELQSSLIYEASDEALRALTLDDPTWSAVLCKLQADLKQDFPVRQDKRFYVPVNINQLISFVKTIQPTPSDDDRQVVDWAAWYRLIAADLEITNLNALIRAHFVASLSPARVEDLTASQRRWVLQNVVRRWHHALAAPGEKVGIIAAQSFGQLAVQATLVFFGKFIANETSP